MCVCPYNYIHVCITQGILVQSCVCTLCVTQRVWGCILLSCINVVVCHPRHLINL